jgi:hypothetical protein
MSYTPPTTFTNGTILTSSASEGNLEALRVYLHNDVVAGDLEASQWIQTRHIQPPEYLPFQGLQHGVSGYQGGQWAGGAEIRLTFATKYLTGNGQPSVNSFQPIPNTAFQLDIRRSGGLLFHYWWEMEVGQDNSTAPYQVAQDSRSVFIAPYVGQVSSAFSSYRAYAQEQRNQEYGISATYPIGMAETYVQGGGYGQKQGTLMMSTTNGLLTFGLAFHSQVSRVGVVNWGVNVEVFYL